MKRFFLALVAFSLLAALLVACGGTSNSSSGGSSTVHMTGINFTQSSITIPKGSTLTMVDDSSSPHILANGRRMNGSPQGMHEQGLPSMMTNMQVMGKSSQPIGPFTTPGTYHLYCTIHPGMNLTVILQ